jgi:hypothetical protein
MRTKIEKTNLPARQTGNENKVSLQGYKSYSDDEDISSLESYEINENAGSELGENNYYSIGGDDYYYLEVEEG